MATAQRLFLAALCGLLLVSNTLAQEGQPEERQAPEPSTTQKAPDPNETVTPAASGNQSGAREKDEVVEGDLIFTSPGTGTTYPRDIRLSDNFGVLRLYGADALTSSPAGAAVQLFGNNAENFNGQLLLDSGAHDSAALIFRTAGTGGTLTERMRVMSDGTVSVGTTNPLDARLFVKNPNNGEPAIFGSSSFATDGIGVKAAASGEGGIGLHAWGSYLAGYFQGDVHVSGFLTKASGTFKIDHPLDPENKYLSHSFVESPDMMNIYNGIVVLDGRGRATITMPAYFEALNREFRYQLTAVGAPGPNLYVAEKIKGNRFRIAGGKPGTEVSWQVTGVRQDAYAEKHRVKVEEVKPAQERGTYLHPEAFGQPAEKGVNRARHAAPTQQPSETVSAGVNAAERTTLRQRRATMTRR